jgi:putative phosphoribosyl transferase
MFRDRQEAGQMLAFELAKLTLQDPIVMALPRGGVPVAVELAKTLQTRLDLILVRKVGAPGNPELAVAAIVDGDPPDVVLNREIVETYGLGDDALRARIAKERPELARLRMAYRGGEAPLPVDGKTVIIVDDGAATGTTMKAAIRALKRRSPRKIIAALPVSPPDTATELAQEADLVICLSQPARFRALSYYYMSFPQLTDRDVLDAMNMVAQSGPVAGSGNGKQPAARSARARREADTKE